MTTQAPARVPYRIVTLAARTLPRSHRDRYRSEFTAELHAIPREHQLRYATEVLSRAWALRAALSEAGAAPIGESTMTRPQAPLSCRLMRWHQWGSRSTEDGERYLACKKCGRDRPPPSYWFPVG
jgi:hypothetical protein